MTPATFRPPTPDDLAAVAARWATRGSGLEDETTIVISGHEPDVFYVWSSRGPDVRSILRRVGDRVLALEDHGYGLRFTFPRSALSMTGAGALLSSQARQRASRGHQPRFAPSLTGRVVLADTNRSTP